MHWTCAGCGYQGKREGLLSCRLDGTPVIQSESAAAPDRAFSARLRCAWPKARLGRAKRRLRRSISRSHPPSGRIRELYFQLLHCSVYWSVVMGEWSPDTRRVLRAYLDAVAMAEPLQRELARMYGVALGDLHALRLLRDLGTVPIGRLGSVLQLHPSSATNLADRLEGAGLVERSADPSDRRVTLLRLTARASDALGDRALLESSGLVARIERLSPGERQQLATLLERLLEHGADEATPDGSRSPATGQHPAIPASPGPSEGAAGEDTGPMGVGVGAVAGAAVGKRAS
jgi:DNA-binding MarR family transcriptional regulator